jgi:SAM-dependent methyltransferase
MQNQITAAPHLRPDPEQLGREWQTVVLEEYEQVERLREWREADYYRPIAHHFADDPRRADDVILDRLRALSRPDATWLDIGAGGGRYALPLALVSREVTAVDPSAAMLEVLRNSAAQHDISNVSARELRWPDGSDRLRADFTLTAHVGYDIREINPFLDGVEQATGELCVALLMDRAPSGGFIRLWEQVHGEPRQSLPAMREFLHVLLARGAAPEIELYPRDHRQWDENDLRSEARRRLWLAEGSEKDQRLQALISEELAAGVNDYQTPMLIAKIQWRPVAKALIN